MPLYYTTSAPCRPNNAIVIGGVNTAAKRRIQRKALHSCRREMPTPPPTPAPTPAPDPDCVRKSKSSDCATVWPNCADTCCTYDFNSHAECLACTTYYNCSPPPTPAPTPAPDPDCKSGCCKPDCNKLWPDCKVCCAAYVKTVAQCDFCTQEAISSNKCKIPSPQIEHNCLTKEVWTDDKKTWCCNNKNLGCPPENAS